LEELRKPSNWFGSREVRFEEMKKKKKKKKFLIINKFYFLQMWG
jgi:hypothetical protein